MKAIFLIALTLAVSSSAYAATICESEDGLTTLERTKVQAFQQDVILARIVNRNQVVMKVMKDATTDSAFPTLTSEDGTTILGHGVPGTIFNKLSVVLDGTSIGLICKQK